MPKRKCAFTDKLREKYTSFRPGRVQCEAECMVCCPGTYVSIANHGASDLELHMKTEKHLKCVRGVSSSSKVNNFFVKRSDELETKVSAAEGTLAFHTVSHHGSYKSMDCTAGLLREIFPDSSISSKISCGRTKTEAIINSVLAPHSVECVMKDLQHIPFVGVSTDASNHGDIKMIPIIIHYFDYKNGGLQIKLINIESRPNETAETISTYIIDTLNKLKIKDKCVAFGADNCNTMFGGIKRGDGSNVFANLKRILNKVLVGVGCPAHVLNNCIQHGTDLLEIDLQGLIMKIYNHFSIYTVRVESLKEFCDFVDIEYQQLLSHSKTRWLSLFPAIQRLTEMFPALRSFFLSQDKSPAVLKNFFMKPINEVYLWHIQSVVGIFQNYISNLEKEENSLIDVMKILDSLRDVLQHRKDENFMSLSVKERLVQLENDGYTSEVMYFKCSVGILYDGCLEYLNMWVQPFSEFSCFRWLDFTNVLWTDVEESIKFLLERNIEIDDEKCFDQFSNLKKFIATYDGKSETSQKKWCKYVESCNSEEQFSELIKIAQFFFALPAHNACVERLFSLIQAQWTKERNRLTIESIKGIAMVKFNFRHFMCKNFFKYLCEQKELLKKIQGNEKYILATGSKVM